MEHQEEAISGRPSINNSSERGRQNIRVN